MSNRIAVVGMGCVFPGALSPEALWENVVAGRRYFRTLPDERIPAASYFSEDPNAPGKTYSSQMAVIDGWHFDPLEFHIPPVTYNVADIVHWLALWTADKALKDAKLDLTKIDGKKVGVILGNSGAGEFFRSAVLQFRWPYVERTLRRSLATLGTASGEVERIVGHFKQHYQRPLPRITEDSLAGNMSNTIAGRICHQFDFGGGGYTVDGACSSSLLAVNQACEALVDHEMDIALAGGVDVSLDPFEVVGFAKTKALTKTDIRPYDNDADGMLPGEGCGLVVLMRESYAHEHNFPIQAVIRGWGHSTDGRSTGITAPVAAGQMRAITKAYQRAGYSINTVDLFEGHGTGTALGDRTEITALKSMLEQENDQRLHWLGSIKGNIGHCKAAAGVAGLIKAVMALRNKIIPPSVSCLQPNSAFGRPLSVLQPATQGSVWEKHALQPRRAAVSAMGFGGANAHITLEETDESTANEANLAAIHSAQSHELVCLSAESLPVLHKRLQRLLEVAQLICRAQLTDLSATVLNQEQRGRYRIAFVSESPWELAKQVKYVLGAMDGSGDIQALDASKQGIFAGVTRDEPKIALLFPGQGVQRLNMGEAFIRRYPFVRDFYERLEGSTTDLLPERLRSIMLTNIYMLDDERRVELEQRISHTSLAQPSIIAASIANLKILDHLGIKAHVALGHSLGEIAALHWAGVMDDVSAVRIACQRGRLMGQLPEEDGGAMLAVMAPAQQLQALMAESGQQVHISNYNSTRQTVLSDDKAVIAQFARLLEERKIPHRLLNVSHAFHSQFVASATLPFGEYLQKMNFTAPQKPVISSMTAVTYDSSSKIAEQLANQIVEPVQFVQAIDKLAADKPDMWIEVGPGNVLGQFVNDVVDGAECFATNIGNEDGSQLINNIMARAFVIGSPVRLEQLFKHRFYRPFDLEHYQPELIVNPCERPYETPEVKDSTGVVHGGGFSALRPADVEEQAFNDYLAVRGDYLRDLIALDLKHTQSSATRPVTAAVLPTSTTVNKVGPAQALQSVQEFVMAWIAERTGYPRQSIEPGKRLRDDLNLDSIKVGELAIATSQQFTVQFEGDPSVLSNVSIAEFVEQFCRAGAAPVISGDNTSAPIPHVSPLQVVVNWIAERTGYPAQTITAQKRLRDDLNLDSIKVGELAIAMGQHLNVQLDGDPSALSNVTLQEFVDRLKIETTPVTDTPASVADEPVQTYRMEYQPCPLEQETTALSVRNRHGLLVPLLDSTAVAAIEATLRRAGAKIKVLQPAELATANAEADFLLILAAGETPHFVDALTADTQAPIAAEATALLRVMQQAASRLDLRKCKTLVVSLERGDGKQARAGAAMLKTLRQEYSEAMKWLALPADSDPDWMADTLCAELETAGQHIGYVYRDGQRYAELAAPVKVATEPGFSPLNADDVVVVTGGAKGITAELVMALAIQSGATLALLGSSAASHPDVVAGLQRFSAAGIRHQYYPCDVVDGPSVHATLQQIRAELGEPRGVFFGAGVSGLHPFAQLSEADFMRCFRVKAQGLWNILHSLDPAQLKLLHVITSIIGKMGMHGQADYAYANAWLDEAVRALADRYPKLHCLTLGYSVWKGTGLGHKLGVVDSLARQGVSAISVEQGIAAYLRLVSATHPSPVHVIIGSLPATQRSVIMSSRPTVTGRFVEMISDWLPDVSITVEAVLNHHVDRYIAEHVYQGTPLMPGVVALEAMTQVVMACRNKDQRPTQIQEVVFYRPLIVPFGASTRVQISARKRKGQGESYSVELFANKVRYYSASFVFDSAPAEASAPTIGAPLPLSAESYNPYPLFQGKFFRRITNIRQLHAGESVISEIRVPKREELGIFMPEGMHVSAVVRDTFLQTGALALPNGYLPAAMQNYYINAELPEGESVFCECRILSDTANNKLADISIFDKTGRLLEKMAGITLRISAEALNIQHSQFEPESVANAIRRRLRGLSLHGIGMALLRVDDVTESSNWLQEEEIAAFRERVSAARFDTSRNNAIAAKQALAKIRNIDVRAVELNHAPDGRPLFAAKTAEVQEAIAGLQVSLTDSNGLSLGIVATGPVGIDLEPVQERDANNWFRLLGAEAYRRAEVITYLTGEPYDWSATRVWTMLEALRKAGIEAAEVHFERLVPKQGWYETRFAARSQRYILTSAMVDLAAPGEQPAALTMVFVDHEPATAASLLNLTASNDPLSRVEQCLDEFGRQMELGSREFSQDPEHERSEAHQHYVNRLIDETLQNLREAAPGLNREQTKRLQQRGYDLIRRYGQQSNIFYRVLEKPFGYPGDHVLLDRMFRNEVQTTGLAYHLDRCFLDYAGTEAVRQRTYWVVRKLHRMLKEQSRRQLKILDLGAGPMAIERTLAHRFDGRLSISALDFDNNSFEYAKASFDVPAEFYTEQQNLVSPEGIRRIREVAATVDVVCSMGLIEYLGEETVVAILGAIHQGIRPGTQVFTSNYVPNHWSQAPMEWFLDWWLVYRSPQKMAELAVKAGFRREGVELSMDPTGSITLMKLTRH